MARRESSWFGMIVCVVSITSVPGLCRAQQGMPTIEQILQVWKNRQEKVKTARFELNWERTIHKGSSSLLDVLMPRQRRKPNESEPKVEPNPPRDYQVKGASKVILSGLRMGYSYDTQQWDPIAKRLYAEHHVDVFDGRFFKFLTAPASGRKDYPTALVSKATKSRSAGQFAIIPLIFTFRGSHPQFFHDLGKFKVTGRTVEVAGRPCLELQRASDSSGQRELFYLDRAQGYLVVRKTIMVDDQPTWQVNATYNPDATVGWAPRSWEYIIRAGKDGDVCESGRSKVVSYDLNTRMDDNDFNIVFPPGTRVHDTSSGAEVQYVVRENGEKGREVAAAINPTYEDLLKSVPRIKRPVSRVIGMVVFTLALGGWVWLRWRMKRRGRDLLQS